MKKIIGVRFKKLGKIYFFNPEKLEIKKGDKVIVETAQGDEYAEVLIPNRVIEDEKIVAPLKKVVRIATQKDTKHYEDCKKKEKEAFDVCLKKIKEHKLEMTLTDVEVKFDDSKILFYFTADGRIDFRELVKDLAAVFRTRIELRQIGVRDEVKRIGGFGVCGRELCCCSHLGTFETVSIKMAKEQNISLNPTKISGACGRLMCCLKYEEEAYLDKLQNLPGPGSIVKTEEGTGEVVNLEILKENVKVKYHDDKDDSFYFKTHTMDEIEIIKRVYPEEQVNVSAEEMKELQKMEKADKQDDNTDEI